MAVCRAQRAVYIWLHANLLRPSVVHKLAYHAQLGSRSFTSLVFPRLIHRPCTLRPHRHPREAQIRVV